MNKFIVISNQNNDICSYLSKLNYILIHSDCISEFIDYEQKHADMQCLVLNNTVFVLKNAKNLSEQLREMNINIIETESVANGEYPENILLNALVIGQYIVGKVDYLDRKLIEYAQINGFKLINVNQGYTACSCCKISDNAVITTDKSIHRALSETDIDVLKISNNSIVLDDAKRGECGFIGGASCRLDDNCILFFGDITKHEEFESINKFMKKHNVSYKYIENLSLIDIGSAVLLNF